MTEIERFVASLAIPADRKTVVLAELADHVACAREAALREGRDPEAAARAALGDLEAMRPAFEAIEPAFRISRRSAFLRGVVAAAAVAVVVDQLGHVWLGIAGAVIAIAIAVVAAPPRTLDLLRAELRAPHVRGRAMRGIPIGAGLTYVLAVTWLPFVIWIGMIAARTFGGFVAVDVPWSAFAVAAAGWLLVIAEALRARRPAAA